MPRCSVTGEHLLNDKAVLTQLHGLLAPDEPLANSTRSHLEEHAKRLKDTLQGAGCKMDSSL